MVPGDLEIRLERAAPAMEMCLERADNRVDGQNVEPAQAEIRPHGDSHRLFFVTPRGYVREVLLEDEKKQEEFVGLVSEIGRAYPDAHRVDITHLMVYTDRGSRVIENDENLEKLASFIGNLTHEVRPFPMKFPIKRKEGLKGNLDGEDALAIRNVKKAPDDRLSKLPSSDEEIDQLITSFANEDAQSRVKKQLFQTRVLQEGLKSIIQKKKSDLLAKENKRPEDQVRLHSLTSFLEKIESLDTFAITWAAMHPMDNAHSLNDKVKELLTYIEQRPSNRRKFKILADNRITTEETEYAIHVIAMTIQADSWSEEAALYQNYIQRNGVSFKKDSLEEHLGLKAIKKMEEQGSLDWTFLSFHHFAPSLIQEELDHIEEWASNQLFNPELSLSENLENVDANHETIMQPNEMIGLGDAMQRLFDPEED